MTWSTQALAVLGGPTLLERQTQQHGVVGLDLADQLGADEQTTLHRLLQRAAAVTGGTTASPIVACTENDQSC